MAITNEQVERINELARKHKAEGLTEAETAERAELRRIYLDSVRENLRGQVEAVKLVDEDGKDITPEKLKDIQCAKGMRD